MSAWLDKKFINMISHNLEGFQWKSATVAECRCALCGDSKKSKRKKRGAFLGKTTHFNYYCHNCGASMSFYKYLQDNYPSKFDEYKFEWLKEKAEAEGKVVKEPEPEKDIKTEDTSIFSSLKTIESLPDGHFAKEYVRNRQIPQKYWAKLYYAPHYKKWANQHINKNLFEDTKDKEDERLLIPFYNRKGEVIACQGRYIGSDEFKKDSQRYFTQKIGKDNALIHGLDEYDMSKPGKVVEGPIDRFFLRNAIAVAGSSLKRVFEINFDPVYIFDNQPHSREIVKLMQEAITRGKQVFIWPPEIDWRDIKDINDAVLAGIDIEKVIERQTYRGIFAQLVFDQWKKST